MPDTVAEFMRFTAPDAAALARSLDEQHALLARAQQADDPLAIVDHAADLAALLTTARREHDALQLLREHLPLAEARPGEEPAGWFCNAYATALQYAGHRGEADRYFAKTVALARAGGWPRLRAMALHHWGRNLVEQGCVDAARARFADALALRTQLGDARGQASSQAALDALGEPGTQAPRPGASAGV